MFNLIHTSSEPKYTVLTTISEAGQWGDQSESQAGEHDFPTALPMINRGF